MSIFKFKDTEFSILRRTEAHLRPELYNNTYQLWKQVWLSTFKELKENKTAKVEDFFLLDEIFLLHQGNNPMVMVATKWMFLNVNPFLETEYFNTYPEKTLEKLKDRNILSIAGLGNLTCHPEWRRSKINFALADVIVGLSLLRQQEVGIDASICYTRNDRGVNRLVSDLGGVSLWSNLKRHNVDVDVMIIPKENIGGHTDPEVAQLIQYLWKTKYLKEESDTNIAATA